MPQHIYKQYAPGDRVEITFPSHDAEWQPAVVVRHEPPGIWVRTDDGREWFMTNTFRIRPAGKCKSWISQAMTTHEDIILTTPTSHQSRSQTVL